MKESILVNISGSVFYVDADAYKVLNQYMQTIESHYATKPGGIEIYNDIEFKIAEFFHTKVDNTKEAITIIDVNEMIEIMGQPEEYVYTDTNSHLSDAGSHSKKFKRIYRDVDKNILGGVCAGLGAYLRIDPIIFRLAFLVAFLVFGTGTLVYIVMWILIPPARTVEQKLEMRGIDVQMYRNTDF